MKKIHVLTEEKLKVLVNEKARELVNANESAKEKELIEKTADLNALQSQINPHFLYNALESIRGQAILDSSPVIEQVAQALGDYFRYNISGKSNLTILSAELENIRNYVGIQQFRFQNRFNFCIKYDPEDMQALNTVLPRMTLQPIVENAILHGFERSRQERLIRIEIVFTGKNVRIVVSDNGMGMDAATLQKLNDGIRGVASQEAYVSSSGSHHSGIAIPNVHKRIQLMYGEDYGIHVESILGVGTDVEVFVPFCPDYQEPEQVGKS